jgi:hypothetical protein
MEAGLSQGLRNTCYVQMEAGLPFRASMKWMSTIDLTPLALVMEEKTCHVSYHEFLNMFTSP